LASLLGPVLSLRPRTCLFSLCILVSFLFSSFYPPCSKNGHLFLHFFSSYATQPFFSKKILPKSTLEIDYVQEMFFAACALTLSPSIPAFPPFFSLREVHSLTIWLFPTRIAELSPKKLLIKFPDTLTDFPRRPSVLQAQDYKGFSSPQIILLV